jgi:hypothetical protein
LFNEQVKRAFQIDSNCAWSGRAVRGPPLDDAFDLGGCPPRDMKFERHF